MQTSFIKRPRMNTTGTALPRFQAIKEKSMPNDVVLDILKRLPVKSILRFKLLSKECCSTISSPFFHEMHHEKSSKNNLRLLFQDKDQQDRKVVTSCRWVTTDIEGNRRISADFVTNCRVYNIIASGFGLICFSGSNNNNHKQLIFVCNPSTKEVIALPSDPSSSMFSKYPIAGFGMGYDAATKVYKVVHLFYTNYNPCSIPDHQTCDLGCEVIELTNGSHGAWRVVQEKCHIQVNRYSSPVFVNETLYWKANNHSRMEKLGYIVSFNVKKEEFQILDSPEDCLVRDKTFLIDFEGKLAVADASRTHITFGMEIIVLQKDHEENWFWEKVYRVSTRGLSQLDLLLGLKPINVKNGEILMHLSGYFLAYNIEKTCIQWLLEAPMPFVSSGIFYESLFSLGSA
ncbi:F-box protein [Quillaja saponaria]|uniref:F-box protein n=1 Tax=Quillaja saponaria TaxID=32244 RepID=A0AAD7KPB3_QUISA|nr:F-box protein [Quillaja saponaria]